MPCHSSDTRKPLLLLPKVIFTQLTQFNMDTASCWLPDMFIQFAGASCTSCARALYCYLSHETLLFGGQATVAAKHTVHVA